MSAVARPFVIGLTGNIACGKSTVLRFLTTLGAETIDADVVYHELIAPGSPLWHSLQERFGRQIVDQAGAIDRRLLGRIVFADPARLAELDELTHPAVAAAIRARIAGSRAAVLAIDAVKLVESGLDADCDQLWLVECDPARQIARLMTRNGLDRDEAERRVAVQPPLAETRRRADVVIDNRGNLEATRAQVERAWQTIPR